MTARSKAAFDGFREAHGPARAPVSERIRNKDELKQMTADDGLKTLADGPVQNEDPAPQPAEVPMLTQTDLAAKQLWVVEQHAVVYADELCPFGKTLESHAIKHTNLTGGAAAYSGGELLWLDAETVIINGHSGRYGVRSPEEMNAVSIAFRKSGYNVWSMGYDIDADLPYPFIGVTPQWLP